MGNSDSREKKSERKNKRYFGSKKVRLNNKGAQTSNIIRDKQDDKSGSGVALNSTYCLEKKYEKSNINGKKGSCDSKENVSGTEADSYSGSKRTRLSIRETHTSNGKRDTKDEKSCSVALNLTFCLDKESEKSNINERTGQPDAKEKVGSESEAKSYRYSESWKRHLRNKRAHASVNIIRDTKYDKSCSVAPNSTYCLRKESKISSTNERTGNCISKENVSQTEPKRYSGSKKTGLTNKGSKTSNIVRYTKDGKSCSVPLNSTYCLDKENEKSNISERKAETKAKRIQFVLEKHFQDACVQYDPNDFAFNYRVPTDREISRMAPKIGKEYFQLGIELGLNKIELCHIETDNREKAVNCNMEILFKWRQNKCDDATYGDLRKALIRVSKTPDNFFNGIFDTD